MTYKAKICEKCFGMVNDKKATPEFDIVVFAKERFDEIWELIFAGYDREQHEIFHAISLVEVRL